MSLPYRNRAELFAALTPPIPAYHSRYKQRKDGEGFTVPNGEVYRLACCDCGLVHDMVFVSEDGKPIGIAARRNNRATAQRRRTKPPSKQKGENEQPDGETK